MIQVVDAKHIYNNFSPKCTGNKTGDANKKMIEKGASFQMITLATEQKQRWWLQ